jgi:hypothetical protein
VDVRFTGGDVLCGELRLVDQVHPEVFQARGLAQRPVAVEPVGGIFFFDPALDFQGPEMEIIDEVNGLVLELGREILMIFSCLTVARISAAIRAST